jgi:hypothetical protein
MVRGLEMDQDLEKTALYQYIGMELDMVPDQVMDLELIMDMDSDLAMAEAWDSKFMKTTLINQFKGLIADSDSAYLFKNSIAMSNGRGFGQGLGFCYGVGEESEDSCGYNDGDEFGSGNGLGNGNGNCYGDGDGDGVVIN